MTIASDSATRIERVPSPPVPRRLIIDRTAEIGTLRAHRTVVKALVIHDDIVLATTFFERYGSPGSSPAAGELVFLDRTSLEEAAPRVTVGFCPDAIAVNRTTGRLYVLNRGNPLPSITVVDLDTLRATGETLAVPGGAAGLAVDQRANLICVGHAGNHGVMVLSGRDHSFVHDVRVADGGIRALAVDEVDGRLFVSRFGERPGTPSPRPFDDVLAFAWDGNRYAPDAGSTESMRPRSHPVDVAYDPIADRVVTLDQGGGTTTSGVSCFTPGRPGKRHGVLQGPRALAADPFTGVVHVSTVNKVITFDADTLQPVGETEVFPFASGVANHRSLDRLTVDAATSLVCAADSYGRVIVLDLESGHTEAPRAAPGAPICTLAHGGELDLFVVGDDNVARTAHWSEARDWDFARGWLDLPGSLPSLTPLAAVSPAPGSWQLFAVHGDGQLYGIEGDIDGATGSWTPVVPGFPVRAPVAALSRVRGERTVFAVDHHGQVWCATGTDGLTATVLRDAPPVAPGSPVAAVSRKDDHWDVFVLADDGAVWTTWWSTADGFQPWESIGGWFPPGTPITVVARRHDHLDVFAVGADGRVWSQWWSGDHGWSGWDAVDVTFTVPVRSRVAAVSRHADQLDLFVTGSDQQVHTNWWGAGSGQWNGFVALGGRVTMAGAPIAAVAKGVDLLDVFWPAEEGAVETAWWHPLHHGTGWSLAEGIRRRVPTDSFVSSRAIHTDSPVNGGIVIRCWRDGGFRVSGHMRGSGLDPYRFSVQSAIASSNGNAVANYKTGKVGGTFDSADRDFDWLEIGVNPVIAGDFDALAQGALEANHVVKNIGFGGVIDSLVPDVLVGLLNTFLFGTNPTGMIIKGVVAAIGNELVDMVGLSDTGVGGMRSVIVAGGCAWLTGSGMMTPVLTPDVVVGGITELLGKVRQIDDHEYAFAVSVLGSHLPPRDNIYLTNLKGLEGRAFVFPINDHDIYVNLADDDVYDDPVNTTAPGDDEPGQLFIHEMMHPWQIANATSRTAWLSRGSHNATTNHRRPGRHGRRSASSSRP